MGSLVAALAARLPGAEVTLVDVDLSRRAVAEALGCRFAKPLDSPGGRRSRLPHLGDLGGPVLRPRLRRGRGDDRRDVVVRRGDHPRCRSAPPSIRAGSKLISSQVGRVSESRRGRWSYARRLQKALALLDDPRLDAIITEEVAFADLPEALPRLFAPGAPGLATAIRYT